MAVLGVDRLLQLVKSEKLVEGLSERELTNPEGAGFDIRAGEVYRLEGKGFLGVEERATPNAVAAGTHGKDVSVQIKPGEYVLVKTIESFNIPTYLTMHAFPRSTLHRSGILLLATQTAPGYRGQLVFGMKNLGESAFELELGARIAHVQFHAVEGAGSAYRGQWQGGRVSVAEKERQV